MRHSYVAHIHWDDTHTSPTLGPFRTQAEANKWKTEFRAAWVQGQKRRRKKNRKPPPRVVISIMLNPAYGVGWALSH